MRVLSNWWDSVSDLPIDLPRQWFNTKLNPVKFRSLWDLLLLLKKCYYFSSTWIIVSIFLLYILLLCSTGEKNLLKKAIRCHLPFSLDAWGRTSSIAKLELFTSIWNNVKVFMEVRIGAEVTIIFNILNASCWLVFHVQRKLLLVMSKRGCTIAKNLQINLQ